MTRLRPADDGGSWPWQWGGWGGGGEEGSTGWWARRKRGRGGGQGMSGRLAPRACACVGLARDAPTGPPQVQGSDTFLQERAGSANGNNHWGLPPLPDPQRVLGGTSPTRLRGKNQKDCPSKGRSASSSPAPARCVLPPSLPPLYLLPAACPLGLWPADPQPIPRCCGRHSLKEGCPGNTCKNPMQVLLLRIAVMHAE